MSKRKTSFANQTRQDLLHAPREARAARFAASGMVGGLALLLVVGGGWLGAASLKKMAAVRQPGDTRGTIAVMWDAAFTHGGPKVAERSLADEAALIRCSLERGKRAKTDEQLQKVADDCKRVIKEYGRY